MRNFIDYPFIFQNSIISEIQDEIETPFLYLYS